MRDRIRILLDECVHSGMRQAFPGHSVRTVSQAGWRQTKDGPLLTLAESNFDVFITIDSKLERENQLEAYHLGFVIVWVPGNQLRHFEPLFELLQQAAESVKPGEVIHLSAPKNRRV